MSLGEANCKYLGSNVVAFPNNPVPQGSVLHQFIENQCKSSKRYPSRFPMPLSEPKIKLEDEKNNNAGSQNICITNEPLNGNLSCSSEVSSRTQALSHVNLGPISLQSLNLHNIHAPKVLNIKVTPQHKPFSSCSQIGFSDKQNKRESTRVLF